MKTINRPMYTPGIEPAPVEYPTRGAHENNFFLGQNDFSISKEWITALVAGGLLLLFVLGRKK